MAVAVAVDQDAGETDKKDEDEDSCEEKWVARKGIGLWWERRAEADSELGLADRDNCMRAEYTVRAGELGLALEFGLGKEHPQRSAE